ncbi:MAG: hypothetical protein JNN20_06560 [Betaproteobacteria bacterium]|nr:hypothetical protein [Betaproteobacteria bacterium]
MIQDKNAAKILLDAALAASRELNNCLLDIQQNCNEDEFTKSKRAIGQCMGEMYDELIRPVLETHPDLTPIGLKT